MENTTGKAPKFTKMLPFSEIKITAKNDIRNLQNTKYHSLENGCPDPWTLYWESTRAPSDKPNAALACHEMTAVQMTLKRLVRESHKNLCSLQPIVQGRIQCKLEGGAVGSGGAEKFSKIGDESTLYTTNSHQFSE